MVFDRDIYGSYNVGGTFSGIVRGGLVKSVSFDGKPAGSLMGFLLSSRGMSLGRGILGSVSFLVIFVCWVYLWGYQVQVQILHWHGSSYYPEGRVVCVVVEGPGSLCRMAECK